MNITPKLYEKNVKKHSQIQLYKIALSVKNFGWRQSIVCAPDGTIIVGHGRWLSYVQYKDDMQLPEPKIEVAEDLTEEQIKAYRLADNLVVSDDYDMDLMEEETSQLPLFAELLENKPSEIEREGDKEEKITDEGYLAYLNQSVRQIVMHFSNEEFTPLIKLVEDLKQKYGFETTGELFKFLIAQQPVHHEEAAIA